MHPIAKGSIVIVDFGLFETEAVVVDAVGANDDRDFMTEGWYLLSTETGMWESKPDRVRLRVESDDASGN